MKHLRFALVALASGLGIAFAQDEERRAPPIEIPDFSNLEDIIYEPKSTVTFGFRYIGGPSVSFSGGGNIPAPEDPGPEKGQNLTRNYHDGVVRADTRVTPRLDNSGNPIIDPVSNNPLYDPIAPDGRTNSWVYTNAAQLSRPGYVAFHSYSAEIVDTRVRERKGNAGAGFDLAMSREMGKLFGGRVLWSLTAGISINDLSANTSDLVRAQLTTLTDYYSLYGATPPAPPYSSPSSVTTTLTDASGNPLLNDDGSFQTVTTDTSILIDNEPAARVKTDTTDETSVTNRWKLRGAYYTFRAGPTVLVPITGRLRASFSVGAAVVYAGSSYTVTQTFQPELGAEISDTNTSSIYKLLPGYYADATVQFDLTDRTGFYAGAVLQSTGSYDQSTVGPTTNYSTKIDLANLNGVRAGLSYRF